MREFLTVLQARFVDEYVIDGNGTRAAIAAGYSEKGASQQAHALLKLPEIQDAVGEAIQARAERTHVTQDKVILELAKMAFANFAEFSRVDEDGNPVLDMSEATADHFAAVTEITNEIYTEGRGNGARDVKRTKIKLADKQAALVKLGQHLGMFVKQSEVKHDLTGGIVDLLKEIDGTSRST